MNKIQLALVSIAHRDIPDNTNLWPAIEAGIERKETRKMTSRLRFVWALILILLALLLAAAAYQFFTYRGAGLDGLQNTPQAAISITSPQSHTQAPEGAAIPVSVSTHAYQPLVSTELWVNGKLMGVQAAPPGGLPNFDTSFFWLPGGTGEFTLVARSIDAGGDASLSPAVIIDILPAPATSGQSFDAGAAMVIPPVPAGGPALGAPPSADARLGPAQSGAPTIGDFLTHLINGQPPKAPALAVAVRGCSAMLEIHDLSNNEEGFQVFRSVDYAQRWSEIATLNSQSALGWITYTDSLKGAGQASYYVVAINKMGQGKSNPVTAAFSTGDCPDAVRTQPQELSLEPVSLKINLPVDRAYCYKSLNERDWERWPETGFFLPGRDGFDIQKYGLNFAINGVDGSPQMKTFQLSLECWGWTGGTLKFLGQAHFSNDLTNLRPQQEQQDGNLAISFKFSTGHGSLPQGCEVCGPATPESGQMPYIFAQLTYNGKYCVDHLAPPEQNILGGLILCSHLPGYTPGEGSANPQPYLLWFVSDTFCPNGSGAACKSLSQLQAIAKANNGELAFIIHSSASKSDATGPIDRTAYVIPPEAGCFGKRQFTVRISYGDPNTTVLGPASNIVQVPCFKDANTKVGLNLSFDTLTLSNVSDGYNGNDNLELYGALSVYSSDGSSDGTVLQYYPSTGCATDGLPYLPSPGLPIPPVVLDTNGTSGCNRLGNGSFSLASDVSMCPSMDFFNCSPDLPEKFNQNVPHITVGDGGHFILQVMLMDYDSASADDSACFATLDSGSKSLEDWANSEGQTFELSQADNGNAACDVHVTLHVGDAVQGLGKIQQP